MDEIRRNQILILEPISGGKIEGTVLEYEKDRVEVLVDENFLSEAQKLEELDLLDVTAHTLFGIKKMKSHVISKLNGRSCILIENNEALKIVQKRDNVRAAAKIEFVLNTQTNSCYLVSANISASAVAFKCSNLKLNIGEIVEIIFPFEVFSKEIKVKAEIIKAHDDFFVAKYENLNKYDESKILQKIFKLLSQK